MRSQSTKAVTTNATSNGWNSNGSSSWTNGAGFSSAFAALTAFGGAATLGMCESTQKDPMTKYQVEAMKTNQIDDDQTEANSPLYATSSKVKEVSDLTEQEARLEKAAHKAKKHAGGLKLFSGNGNMALSLEIAQILGINLGKATVGRFADGETNVMIHENVRGKDVYVIQPTCPPVNDNIMELLLMVSTLNRASARRITVVIPYYGYARQDRKMQVSKIKHASADAQFSFHCNCPHHIYFSNFLGPCTYLSCGCRTSFGSNGDRSCHCC